MIRAPRLPALVGLLLSLSLIWAAGAGIFWNRHSPTLARDAKYASAERLVFYRLEPGDTLSLPLPSDAQALRILTHLVLPPGTAYAPEHQYVYGVSLRLQGAQGQALLDRSLFTRARQSKAQPEDGLWMQEGAFTADPGVQLTDGREFPVGLPPAARGAASHLQLRYPGARGALLVRVYARGQAAMPLSISGKTRAMARAESRAERVTFEPWAKLSPGTQRELTEAQWLRVGADGEEGKDYRTEPVYRTAFRLPLLEVAESSQERLEPQRAAALNVQGPAKLRLRLWSVSPEATSRSIGAVSLHTLAQDGHTDARTLDAPAAGELSTTEVELPAGVHTLTLANASAQELRYTLEGPREAWFAPEELKSSEGRAIAFLPDARRSESHVAGPGCQAYELDVDADRDAAARLLRLDARALLRGAAPPAASSVTLTLLDARGRTLGESRLEVPAQPSQLERVNLPPLPHALLPCEAGVGGSAAAAGVELTDGEVGVTQVASARLVLPRGTRRVRVTASRPTAVNLHSYLPAKQGRASAAPYAADALSGVRWRHAPLEARSWYALRPFNHRALSAEGAAVELVSQVHLEPLTPPRSRRPAGVALTLTPAGTPRTQQLLEPVDADAREQDATRTAFTLLAPGGGAVRAHFDARVPTRPELQLRLDDPEALGSEVEVLVDGASVHRTVLHATRSRELLPPIPPGVHEVLLRSSASGLSALLNRPPAQAEGPGEGLRARTVYRLEEGGLRVPVHKPGRAAITLNMVLYAQGPSGSQTPRLRVSLDDGAPRRRTGQLLQRLTQASHALPLPASDRAPAFTAAEPQSRWHPRRVAVTLGEDLAPGLHWVHVRAQEGSPLWARFFVYGEDALDAVPQQWNRSGWEPGDTL